MPFVSSNSRADNNFDLIHYDMWTSLIVSISGYKYYMIILDYCSHFYGLFLSMLNLTLSPLCQKNAYVSTQFSRTIKVV
jgi:hypothetical protein